MGNSIEQVKPSPLVSVGERSISRDGFTTGAAEAHLNEHLKPTCEERWCDPGCLARGMWGQRSEHFRREALKRLPRLRTELLTRRNLFLVTEYGNQGRVKRFKLYETSGSTEETVAAEVQYDRLVRRGDVSTEVAQQIRALLDAPVPASGESEEQEQP